MSLPQINDLTSREWLQSKEFKILLIIRTIQTRNIEVKTNSVATGGFISTDADNRAECR